MHGAARVTADVAERLAGRSARPLVRVDTNDDAGLARRLVRLVRGLLVVLVGAPGRGSLYVGGAGGELVWYQALLVLLARVTRRPAAYHHHNYSYLHERSAAMAALVRCGGPRLVHVVLGDVMAARLQELYPGAARVLTCSNAGLMSPVPPGDAPVGGAFVLGHLSNLSLEKGLADVVASLDRALDAGLDARLLLAGPCSSPEAQALVDDVVRRHPDRVAAPGRLDGPAVDAFYRDIDLFVFPSTYVNEAEPLVVLDALRHGVPAVAYDTGCLQELVEPGHLVRVGDDLPAAVVEAVRGAGPDDAERARRRFEQRRDAALVAHEQLLEVLAPR
ncbi:hypothetical protein ASD11_00020 [Aeromicrobium sp. Root495]|nr:hypothetical protein ASD11_00020 [Aeromicrobium sp. Root495]